MSDVSLSDVANRLDAGLAWLNQRTLDEIEDLEQVLSNPKQAAFFPSLICRPTEFSRRVRMLAHLGLDTLRSLPRPPAGEGGHGSD